MRAAGVLWFCATVWSVQLPSEAVSPQGATDELRVTVCEKDAHRTLEIHRIIRVEQREFDRLELKLPWGQYEQDAGVGSP